jgi:pantetheine-phosphate adenylyltransferase
MPAMSGRGRALYPGSFDPVSYGHLDLIRRGVALFGKLTVAVAANPSKAPLFTPEERVAILKESLKEIDGVEVTQFRGLVVEYCQQNGYSVILRGLRTVSDFEFEYQMALTNRALSPGVETVFVMPNEKYSYISSRLIKEVLEGGGDVAKFLPPEVEARLRQKLQRPRTQH